MGAAVGLLAVLLTRGPEIELPRGTTLDAVLDRPLYLDSSKVNFTEPGRASDDGQQNQPGKDLRSLCAAQQPQQLIEDKGDHRDIDDFHPAKVVDDLLELLQEVGDQSAAPKIRAMSAICA